MFRIFKKAVEKKTMVYSPVKGKIRPLSEVDDETFQAEKLGKTIAIDPMDNTIYAPVSGVVMGLFPTCQSMNIRSDNGQDILLHIGVNTHMLNGTGFMPHIHKGDHVKAGDRILNIDKDMMVKNQYDPVVLLIVTNTKNFKEVVVLKTAEVEVADELLETKI